MKKLRAHLVVAGMVQGVAYRASARDEGRSLGLCGWVRNLDSGEVEAEVEGPEDAVEGFVAWCHRGPSFARVAAVHVERKSYVGDLRGFHITF